MKIDCRYEETNVPEAGDAPPADTHQGGGFVRFESGPKWKMDQDADCFGIYHLKSINCIPISHFMQNPAVSDLNMNGHDITDVGKILVGSRHDDHSGALVQVDGGINAEWYKLNGKPLFSYIEEKYNIYIHRDYPEIEISAIPTGDDGEIQFAKNGHSGEPRTRFGATNRLKWDDEHKRLEIEGDIVVNGVTIDGKDVVLVTRRINTGNGLTGGGELTHDLTLSVVPDTTNQRIELKHGDMVVGTRHAINFLNTSTVTWSITDNPQRNELNISATSVGGGGGDGGDFVDPTTTLGDILVRGSTMLQRFGVGANGQVLTIDPGAPLGLAWKSPAITSVFGRLGAVVAQAGDYTAAQVTHAVSEIILYDNPTWLNTLAWAKITGAPPFVDSSQTYNNPSWLATLDWSKITNTPDFTFDPAPPVNSVQFNNNQAFGGNGTFVWLNASKRLGIGIGDPQFTVDIVSDDNYVMRVDSTTNFSGLIIDHDNDEGGGQSIISFRAAGKETAVIEYDDDEDNLIFWTGDRDAGLSTLVCSTRSFVGVRTGDPEWPLDVNGDVNITGNNRYYRINGIPISTPPSTGGVTQGYQLTVGAGGSMEWTAPATQLWSLWGGSTIYTNSPVGINTTDVAYRFEVAGRIRLKPFGAETAGCWFNSATRTDAFFLGVTGSSDFRLYSAYAAANVLFFDGVNSRAGFNKASADYTVDVNGDCNISGVYRVNGVPLSFGTTPPAGSSTQVQYNNNGAFGASANLTFNQTTNQLWLTGYATINQTGTAAATTLSVYKNIDQANNEVGLFYATHANSQSAHVAVQAQLTKVQVNSYGQNFNPAAGDISLANTGGFNLLGTSEAITFAFNYYESARFSRNGDLNISGRYLVNGVPLAAPINYSNNEQATGIKWVDGRMIYQKTIQWIGFDAGMPFPTSHGIANLSTVINAELMVASPQGFYPAVWVHPAYLTLGPPARGISFKVTFTDVVTYASEGMGTEWGGVQDGFATCTLKYTCTNR